MSVEEKPIDSWQEPVGEATWTFGPMAILQVPVVRQDPANTPISIEAEPVVDIPAPAPIAMLLVVVVIAPPATEPIRTLKQPEVILHPELTPIVTLLMPDVRAVPALLPTAVLPVPDTAKAALQPSEVLVSVVQPRTMPAAIGVAATMPGTQQRPVVAVEQAVRI